MQAPSRSHARAVRAPQVDVPVEAGLLVDGLLSAPRGALSPPPPLNGRVGGLGPALLGVLAALLRAERGREHEAAFHAPGVIVSSTGAARRSVSRTMHFMSCRWGAALCARQQSGAAGHRPRLSGRQAWRAAPACTACLPACPQQRDAAARCTAGCCRASTGRSTCPPQRGAWPPCTWRVRRPPRPASSSGACTLAAAARRGR